MAKILKFNNYSRINESNSKELTEDEVVELGEKMKEPGASKERLMMLVQAHLQEEMGEYGYSNEEIVNYIRKQILK